MLGELRPALLVLLGAVGLVLLTAYANAGHLILGRALARERELAVRAALAASRTRIVAEILSETLLISLLGGALGFLLTHWAVSALVALIPPSYIPAESVIDVGPAALFFSLGAALALGGVFGLGSALSLSRPGASTGSRREVSDQRPTLEVAAPAASWWASEIALAAVVLTIGARMTQTYFKLREINLGFRPEGALTLRIALPASRYETSTQVAAFLEELEHRLASEPGVTGVAAVSSRPMAERETIDLVTRGRPGSAAGGALNAEYRVVSPTYFEVLGVPLRSGRAFSGEDDGEDRGGAIVNETFARELLPGKDPLGESIRLASGEGRWLTIVGVVADAKQRAAAPARRGVPPPLGPASKSVNRLNGSPGPGSRRGLYSVGLMGRGRTRIETSSTLTTAPFSRTS